MASSSSLSRERLWRCLLFFPSACDEEVGFSLVCLLAGALNWKRELTEDLSQLLFLPPSPGDDDASLSSCEESSLTVCSLFVRRAGLLLRGDVWGMLPLRSVGVLSRPPIREPPEIFLSMPARRRPNLEPRPLLLSAWPPLRLLVLFALCPISSVTKISTLLPLTVSASAADSLALSFSSPSSISSASFSLPFSFSSSRSL
mmetsp:Transcript_7542/g.31902  ORF Transcript_7542/g.31902 Transcript_7542/m.31902 type:complete len:201 (-) Transcript_7542:424-1026(-)